MDNGNYNPLIVDESVFKVMEKFFADEEMGYPNARITAKHALEKYLVKTSDGSYTFKSDDSHGDFECMHTNHGAVSEALEKFVKPAKLEGNSKVHVLDICSGLGYNAASCIEYLNPDVEINIDMVEISKETLALSLMVDTPLKSYDVIKNAVEAKLYQDKIINFKHFKEEIPERININIYLDDAREVVKTLKGQKEYDAIFLDPFSPLKSPELYTQEFIGFLKDLLKVDGIILTYTSAAPVRAALVENDLHIGEGPSFNRSGGTLASLDSKLIDVPISKSDERMIALSDAGTPFKDPEFNGLSQSILKNRSIERESLRLSWKFPSTVKTPIYLNKKLPEGRLKRRVLNNIKRMGFDDLKSFRSRYVVCPQYSDCICGKGCKNYNTSVERINEMKKRLKSVLS